MILALMVRDIYSQKHLYFGDGNGRYGSGWVSRKHAGFALPSEGRVVRKPCERLSGHGSSPLGEESEALNRVAFDSQGQKRRAFEPLCLSNSNGFLNTQPEPIHITDIAHACFLVRNS